MRFSQLAILALSACVAACGGSNEPTRQWETSGFQNPESAVPDVTAGMIYVSNVAGNPADKDGNGFISKLSLDGKMVTEKWITGLDAPKGLALYGGRLFVADIDKLVEIDIAAGTIAASHEAVGAKLLNDVTADDDGGIYVSDWVGNAIWRYADGTFEKWLESDKLMSPNGLLVEGDRLIVAGWGTEIGADYSTKAPGHLLQVSIPDKTISDLGNGKPVGNLDGLEAYDDDTYLVTDWVAGKVFQIDQKGNAKVLLTLKQGTADLNFDPETRIAVIPLMVEGKVVAYKF